MNELTEKLLESVARGFRERDEARAEISRLKAEMDQRMAAYVEYQERDEAEIERLKSDRRAAADAFAKLEVEIARLKALHKAAEDELNLFRIAAVLRDSLAAKVKP